MTDAGFFRGTSTEQDVRFSDKEKKLLKTMKFEDCLTEKVDMQKVNLDAIKPWISTKIMEILTLEDELLVEFIFSFLESERFPNAKKLQIQITGFLQSKPARIFVAELWGLLLSAQNNPSKLPEKFIEEKKEAIRIKKEQIEKEINFKDRYSHHRNSPMSDEKRHKQLLKDLNELAGNTTSSKFKSSPQDTSNFPITKRSAPPPCSDQTSHEASHATVPPIQVQKSEVTSTQSDVDPSFHIAASVKSEPTTAPDDIHVKKEPLSPSQPGGTNNSLSSEKVRSTNVPETPAEVPVKGNTDHSRIHNHHRRRSISPESDKERLNRKSDRGRRHSHSPSFRHHHQHYHHNRSHSRSPLPRYPKERSPRLQYKDRSPPQRRRSPEVSSQRNARSPPQYQARRYYRAESAGKQFPTRHKEQEDSRKSMLLQPTSRYSEGIEGDNIAKRSETLERTAKRDETLERKDNSKKLPADHMATTSHHQSKSQPMLNIPSPDHDDGKHSIIKDKVKRGKQSIIKSEEDSDDSDAKSASKSPTPPKRKPHPNIRKKTYHQHEQRMKSASPPNFPNPNPEKIRISKVKGSSAPLHKPRTIPPFQDERRLSSRYHAKPTIKIRSSGNSPKKPSLKFHRSQPEQSEYSSDSSSKPSAFDRRKDISRKSYKQKHDADTSSTKIKSTIVTDERGRKIIKFKKEESSIRNKPKFRKHDIRHGDRSYSHSEDVPIQDKSARELIDKDHRKRVRSQNTYSSLPKKQLKKQSSTSSATSGSEEGSDSSCVSSESDTNTDSSYDSSPSQTSPSPPIKIAKRPIKESYPPTKKQYHSTHKTMSNRGTHSKHKTQDLGELSSQNESTPQRFRLEKKLREKALKSLSKVKKPSSGTVKQHHRK